jgi:sulfur-carrier protein
VGVKILYFAGLRETLGCAEENLDGMPAGVADAASLRTWLCARGEPWDALAPGKSVRIAVNQTLAHPTTQVKDGDEVAFFPPVTGG